MKLIFTTLVTSLFMLLPSVSYAVDSAGCTMVAGERLCPPPHQGGDYDDPRSDQESDGDKTPGDGRG